MRLSVRHEMKFAAADAAQNRVQHLLLTPRDTAGQTVHEWSIAMTGIESAARFADAFGNTACLVSQPRGEDQLSITVSGIVETTDTSGVVGLSDSDPAIALFSRFTPQTKANGNLVNRLRAQQKAGANRIEMLAWLMNVLHEARDGEEDEDEAVEIVAEDHAHVFVGAARGMGIPARFVTGYVLTTDSEPARLHAWAEAFDEELGWVGFDPSANLCPTPAYIRLAAALDADSARPVRLAPDLPRTGADTIAVRQAEAGNQQQ
ncbi:transglutaminase family protein [Pelagibacterium montanilacus]|uniref:transglutaminase family protein n=1 Tax=Pelagibacterium montanilacus TaxID=2185280 RepID=UPI000F8F7206|nr:transglutaminase family protein [Pelagibacterium montanilacus]